MRHKDVRGEREREEGKKPKRERQRRLKFCFFFSLFPSLNVDVVIRMGKKKETENEIDERKSE